MSSYIDLDSIWRDREVYISPANYELTPKQVESWYNHARQISGYHQNPTLHTQEFSTSVQLKYLTLPYSAELEDEPRIYVDVHSRKYRDRNLINAPDARQPDAKFICQLDNIQFDSNAQKKWMHYTCIMEQVMRWRRNDPIVIKITDRYGNVVNIVDNPLPDDPDPDKQTFLTLELIPYIRDGSYDNHMTPIRGAV